VQKMRMIQYRLFQILAVICGCERKASRVIVAICRMAEAKTAGFLRSS